MPETRKHRVEARDELDKALFAALGEPVRPVTPGEATTDHAEDRHPGQADEASGQGSSTPTGAFTLSGTPLPRPVRTYTFGSASEDRSR